ncbi:hypothetical protein LBMAG53_27760 [Planctomycetota bacterium]|nr:hypothetical protein LBMAG53_27760 [Planctomycetota bacterium]
MHDATPAAHATGSNFVGPTEVTAFRRDGFLIVRRLVDADDIAEIADHAQAILDGTLPGLAELIGRDPAGMTQADLAMASTRLHMLHRRRAEHERWLLHERLLDVLAILIGPDVLALQSMLFIKPPGSGGQGWHQDSLYIPTQPLSLCGAWLAVDRVDDENGGVWFAKGSHAEPVYPPAHQGDLAEWGESHIPGVPALGGSSDQRFAPVAERYPAVLGAMDPGDCVFFHGSLLHRSGPNRSRDRLRRAFVGHYCNARSFVGWGADIAVGNVHRAPITDPTTGMTNASHILARGDSHLPFRTAAFGTPCAADWSAEQRKMRSWLRR